MLPYLVQVPLAQGDGGDVEIRVHRSIRESLRQRATGSELVPLERRLPQFSRYLLAQSLEHIGLSALGRDNLDAERVHVALLGR